MSDTERLIEEADDYSRRVEDGIAQRYLEDLVTALRAERERAERAEYDSASVRAAVKIAELTTLAEEMSKKARAELALSQVTQERDELAAGLRSANALSDAYRTESKKFATANRDANKRIEALEHERDEARAELAAERSKGAANG
jgi:hypothetical protein